MSEHDDEPIRGLPGHLPPGEQILWQGAPDWRVLARTGIHAHWVALYFVGLALWNLVNGALSGTPLLSLIGNAALTLAVGSVGVGLLVLYAVLSARTTVYTLTNRRFVLRHGVALSKCFNIPYSAVASAGLKLDAQGNGDIPIALLGDAKIAYPHLWPHVRPWQFVKPEPMMCALPDAAAVADRLTRAVQMAAREADRPFVAEAASLRGNSSPAHAGPSAGQTAVA